jgi:hypothetical protein
MVGVLKLYLKLLVCVSRVKVTHAGTAVASCPVPSLQ